MSSVTSVRMSLATKEKYNWLAGRHDSKTQVLAIAIDRLYQEEKKRMLSRKDETAIIYREWLREDNLKWLTVKTDKTNGVAFRVVGVGRSDSTVAHKDAFPLGSTVKIGDLHCIPVANDVLANIANGINFQIGIMDDGLNELCGELVFARLVNMTDHVYNPSLEMTKVAWKAAWIFALLGKAPAVKFLEESELFQDVYNFWVGGPCRSDRCVVEIEHESCPSA